MEMSKSDYILVTGGAGYIGSHTVVELINHGYNVVIVDNLVNSSYDAVARVEFIVKKSISFHKVDIRDYEGMTEVFKKYKIRGVIHFAALKAVGESTKIPLTYYDNNVHGTLNLLKVMHENSVKTIVFSSSATVYGDATRFENMIPIPEHCPNDPTNPYGKTKYIIENILKDIHSSESGWRCAILRYFNPIGAHPTGLIGEDPLGIPNNLLPYLAQVAIGRREKLSIFGNDYDSHDGTPIRDYIHVVDLAEGHISALNYLSSLESGTGLFREWNLGTGKGSTVFDVYHAFCKAVGRQLPYEIVGRRAGDVLNLTADPRRANKELRWKPQFTIEDACRDLWKWTTENPFGYLIKGYDWMPFNDYENRLHTVKIGKLGVSIANYGSLVQDIAFENQSLINNFTESEDYKDESNPLFGATVGRYANRIIDGTFTINGTEYLTSKNEGDNTLHSGYNGFNKQYFLGPVVKQKKDSVTLQFILIDKDGNDGFPGNLETTVKYEVSSDSLGIEYESRLVDDSLASITPINLTNHTYFNLSGRDTIDGTKVKSVTNRHLMLDRDAKVPTSQIVECDKDLSKGIVLTEDDIFDYCFIVNENNNKLDTRNLALKDVFEAEVLNLKVVFSTTEPSFQFYTGDYTNTKGYGSRSGFCIEPSRIANAINVDKWKSLVSLHKGEIYGSKIKYTFSK
ncbi:uncharacterized protein PRCAT00000077001 [Priceomyces carsonii]|uniref:uncharacterized protein n=1 Tax=Priceomyces carsonii TaxID=28549 RepID=UPI002EDA0371|nr:unnamed protein product [Priceomyces carsonii]